jgi:hypothetical protein
LIIDYIVLIINRLQSRYFSKKEVAGSQNFRVKSGQGLLKSGELCRNALENNIRIQAMRRLKIV